MQSPKRLQHVQSYYFNAKIRCLCGLWFRCFHHHDIHNDKTHKYLFPQITTGLFIWSCNNSAHFLSDHLMRWKTSPAHPVLTCYPDLILQVFRQATLHTPQQKCCVEGQAKFFFFFFVFCRLVSMSHKHWPSLQDLTGIGLTVLTQEDVC